MPKFSLIICTCNRAKDLKEALEALVLQTVPSGCNFEIIVVDNNSEDSTRRVVEDFNAANPIPVRYIFEAKQGKSHALNAGIQTASGDFLFFTDDDVIVGTGWLQSLYEGFKVQEADVVGGKILPLWESPPPDWIQSPEVKQHVFGILALLDYGDEVKVAGASQENFLVGANIAFRKRVFEEWGGYRIDLGPKAGTLLRGEDTEMMRRILAAGKKVVYIPNAVVYHKISAERMGLAYARKRRFDGGRSSYQLLPQEKRRIALWSVADCIQMGLKSVLAYLKGDRNRAISFDLHFWAQLGMITEGWFFQWKKIRA